MPLPIPRSLLVLALVALVLPSACDTGSDPQRGEPAVEVGFHDGGGPYEAVTAGGDWLVIHGFQGGLWTMPTVWVRGLDEMISLDFRLETDAGERLSDLRLSLPFPMIEDGWRRRRDLPVAIDLPVSRLPEILGQPATASWTLEDAAGRTVSLELDVVLREGEPF